MLHTKLTLFFLFLFTFSFSQTDDCYQSFLKAGKEAFDTLNFEIAINNFKAAKICEDKPKGDIEVEEWLERARNGYIDEILKARNQAQQEVIKAKAALYANLAIQEKQKGNFENGMRLAMRAWQMLPDPKPAFAYEAFVSDGFAQKDSFYILTARLNQNRYTSFSPDGQTFLTIKDSLTHLWDLKGQQLVSIVDTGQVLSAKFSPDGQMILIRYGGNTAKLSDLQGKQFAVWNKFPRRFLGKKISFSPNSQMVLTVHEDKTAKLWDLQGKLLLSLEEVRSAKFSPDGQIILGASKESINLWDLQGNLLTELKQEEMWSAEFSPDGQKVLAISGEEGDEIINLWDLQGQLLTSFKPRRSFDEVSSAEFSPDGQIIVLSCSEEEDGAYDREWLEYFDLKGNNPGRLRGNDYDIHFNPDGKKKSIDLGYERGWSRFTQLAKVLDNKGQVLANLVHTEAISQAQFSPDEQKILTLSGGQNTNLWVPEKNLMVLLDGHSNQYRTVQFSPNRKMMLTFQASKTKTAKLWDLQGNLVANLEEPTDTIISAQFSPDGQMIVTSAHSKVKLWDLNGVLLAELNKHTDRISSIKFSPDGQIILTHSLDKTAKLWDLQGNLVADINKDATSTVRFSPDGQRILIKDKESITLWDLKGNLLVDLKITRMPTFSPNGKMLFTFVEGNTLDSFTAKLWDSEGKLLLDTLFETGRYYPGATFSQDSRRLLITLNSYKGRVRKIILWDLKGKSLVDWSRYPIFSPDGQLILNFSGDQAGLWDFEGKLLCNLIGHSGSIEGAKFFQDGQKILTYARDNIAKLWDLKGNLLADMEHSNSDHTGAFQIYEEVLFSPNEQMILTLSNEKSVKLWDLKGNLLAKIEHSNWFNAVLFSPNEQMILIRLEDNSLKLWDLQGNMLADIDKHTDKISKVIFSANSQYILTTSQDKTVKLWDLRGNLLANLDQFPDGISSVEFLPNDRYILTKSKEGVKLWPMPVTIQEWVDDFGEIPFTEGEKLKFGLD